MLQERKALLRPRVRGLYIVQPRRLGTDQGPAVHDEERLECGRETRSVIFIILWSDLRGLG